MKPYRNNETICSPVVPICKKITPLYVVLFCQMSVACMMASGRSHLLPEGDLLLAGFQLPQDTIPFRSVKIYITKRSIKKNFPRIVRFQVSYRIQGESHCSTLYTVAC